MNTLLIQSFKAYFGAAKINVKDTGTTYDIVMLNCPFSEIRHEFTLIADSVFDADRYTHVAIDKQDLYVIFQ